MRTFVRVINLLFVTSTFVWGRNDAPQFVNPNLRLAAMGDLSIVIEEIDNEINFHDFGESVAGVIEDNDNNSHIYMPVLYGYAVYGDMLPYQDWHGSAFSVGGIVKSGSSLAFGGAYSRSWIYSAYDFGSGLSEYNVSRNNDSLLVAYAVLPQLTAGVRGTYDNWDTGEYTLEPSVMVSAWHAWRLGLTYLLKMRSSATVHEFRLPVIYANETFKCGLMGKFQEGQYYDNEQSVYARVRYSIRIPRMTVNIALSSNYATPYEMYDWGVKTGGGIALENEKLGVLGMQYSWTLEHMDIHDPVGGTVTSHMNSHEGKTHLGAEIRVLNMTAVRVGYISATYYSSSYIMPARRDFITAGIGVRLPSIGLSLDLAYNLKIWEYMYSDDILFSPIAREMDNIFGVSGRFTF